MKMIFSVILFLLSAFVLADEKSVYEFNWLDKDKEIYVLQNRKYRKDSKVYIGMTGVKTLTGSFIDSYGGSVRGGYFFKEDWGFEVFYGKNAGSENNTAKGVKEQGTVPFYRKIDSYMGGMLMWSPFYSKINTFNKIFYFDWLFGAGFARLKTVHNGNEFDTATVNEDKHTEEDVNSLVWTTGLRFYMSSSWSLRLDFTGFHYKADRVRKATGSEKTAASSMFSTYDLGLGLNYTF